MYQYDKIKGEYPITHWFQPIYQIKESNVFGYEALLRDASHATVPPIEIFREAGKKGHMNILDRISIKTAVECYQDEGNTLFLNIFPSTLLENGFLSWWDQNVAHKGNIVLELLENEPINDWELLKNVTGELQKRGVKIAVDDMGIGYSFFQQWIELDPDFIKLDRYFAEDLSTCDRKQKTLSSLVELLSDSTDLIIEGIEKKEDLAAAESLGINYAQGYLLGMPSPLDDFLYVSENQSTKQTVPKSSKTAGEIPPEAESFIQASSGEPSGY
ncbi:MAG: EAL domain-containing protein [Pseudomonadota bacterium]